MTQWERMMARRWRHHAAKATTLAAMYDSHGNARAAHEARERAELYEREAAAFETSTTLGDIAWGAVLVAAAIVAQWWLYG